VWHRICDETVGVTQDLWWDCGCDTGCVMRLWVLHRICDETVGVTQDLWWDCGCDAGFVMRLWVWHRIQAQLKVSMNVCCFPQYVGWQWTVKSQIVHWLIIILCASLGSGVAEWLRHCATSREVAGSIPGTICLGSTQPLKLSTRDFSWARDVSLRTYYPCSAERQENPGP